MTMSNEGLSAERLKEIRVGDYSAYDYWIAPSDGPLAAEWNDKPHRLIYDLLRHIEGLGKEYNELETTLRDAYSRVDGKLIAAERERDEARAAYNVLKIEAANASRQAVAQAISDERKRCDEISAQLGLELYEKGDKHGWAICDDIGHRIREAIASALESTPDRSQPSAEAKKPKT